MDHPRSTRRRLLGRLGPRRLRIQIALVLALALILPLLGVTRITRAAGTSTILIEPVAGGFIPEGAGTASFRVHLSDPIFDGAVTMLVSTHDGTSANGAIAPGDYTAVSDSVTFTVADQSEKIIVVPIIQDTLDELNETFTLDATVTGKTTTTTFTAAPATITTILDDDSPTLTFTALPALVRESDGTASFVVTFDAVSPQPVTLTWHLVGVGANPATMPIAADADISGYFGAIRGTWYIPDGTLKVSFPIGIILDPIAEPNEDFQLIIDSATNLTNPTPISGPIITIFQSGSGLPALGTLPTAVNDTPTTTPPVPTLLEDDPATLINVLANDSNPDGGPMSVVSVTQPANGTVTVTNAGADVSYTPAANYCNDGVPANLDTFTYTLNSGSTATVSVAVTCVNDGPIIDANGAATVGIDGTAAYTEGGLAVPIPAVPANLTVTDLEGDQITSVVVKIDNPVDITRESLAVTLPVGSPVTTTNYDPTNGTLTLNGLATTLEMEAVLQTLTYATNPTLINPGNSRTISIVATDNNATPATSIPPTYIVIAITIIDSPPVAVPDTAPAVLEDTATTIDVLANDTDVDGGPKSIGGVTQPANGIVSIPLDALSLTYTPTANYCSGTADTFTYSLVPLDTVTPANSTTTVSIPSVTCVNDAPTLTPGGDITVAEDSGAYGQTAWATAFSPGPANEVTQTLTLTVSNDNTALFSVQPSVDITTGNLTFTPALNANGSAIVTVSLKDNGGGTAPNVDTTPYTFTITVTPVNDPPTVAVNTGLTVSEGGSGNITSAQLSASDPDTAKANLTFTIVATTANGRLLKNGVPVMILSAGDSFTQADIEGGLINYIHDGSNTIIDRFTFNLDDTVTTVSGQTFAITVTPVNDAPAITLNSGAAAYQMGATPVEIDAGAIVTDTDSLNFNGGYVQIVLSGGGAGDTLSVRNDGSGAGLIGRIGSSIYFSGAQIGTVSASSSITLTISLNTNATPAAVQALVRNITFSNTAAATTSGSRVATFIVNDGGLNSLPASRTITFNQPPVAVDDTVIARMNGIAEVIAVLKNDSDADSDTITVTAITQGTHGTVVIGTAGANVTYTPAVGYLGADSFTYTISDTHGGSATATVSVTVKKTMLYLPLVENPAYPDLIVSFKVTPSSPIAGKPTSIEVTVSNIGEASASNFWVDFYIDPNVGVNQTPQVSQRWNDLCRPGFALPCYGMAWYYTGVLAPGQSVVLNSSAQSTGNPNGYKPDTSVWPGYFYNGATKLYALVDSWNRDESGQARDPLGAISERSETNNLAAQDITVEYGRLPARIQLNSMNSLSPR